MNIKPLLLTLALATLLLLPGSGAEAKDTVGKKFYLKNAYCWTTPPGTTRVRHMCLQYCDGRTWKDREGVGCGPRTNIQMSCTSKPRNSRYREPAYVYSSWNEWEGMWLPSPTSSYSAVAVAGECHFTCDQGYERDGSTCKESTMALYGCDMSATCSGTITIGSYTLMACNLGAPVAGTGVESYGCYFQRGNNYGFPNTGNVTTSTSQVDTTGKGPGNYYSSGTFRAGNGDWSNPQNDNLRGGGGDTQANGYSGTNYVDRQGPCPAGYHVPSAGEWGGLINAWHNANTGHGGTYNSHYGLPFIAWSVVELAKFQADTKLPLAGQRRFFNATVQYQGEDGIYSSSSHNYEIRTFYFHKYSAYFEFEFGRADGLSVRCFKNPAPSP